MGRRKESSTRVSAARLIQRARWIALNRDAFHLDVMPAPGIHWMPGDWLADRMVRNMHLLARAIHFDACMMAWMESSFPCSLPSEGDEFEMLFDRLRTDDIEQIRRQVMRAWVLDGEGRMFQKGLVKSWFAQLELRFRNSFGPSLRHGNVGRLTEVVALMDCLGMEGTAYAEISRQRSQGDRRELLSELCGIVSDDGWPGSYLVERGTVGEWEPKENGEARARPKAKPAKKPKPSEPITKIEHVVKAKPNSTASEKGLEKRQMLELMEHLVEGFREGWDSWQAVLPSSKRGTVWADVLKLRKFHGLAQSHGPRDILNMLGLARDKGWRGFEVEWWQEEKRKRANGGGLAPTGPPRGSTQRDDLSRLRRGRPA